MRIIPHHVVTIEANTMGITITSIQAGMQTCSKVKRDTNAECVKELKNFNPISIYKDLLKPSQEAGPALSLGPDLILAPTFAEKLYNYTRYASAFALLPIKFLGKALLGVDYLCHMLIEGLHKKASDSKSNIGWRLLEMVASPITVAAKLIGTLSCAAGAAFYTIPNILTEILCIPSLALIVMLDGNNTNKDMLIKACLYPITGPLYVLGHTLLNLTTGVHELFSNLPISKITEPISSIVTAPFAAITLIASVVGTVTCSTVYFLSLGESLKTIPKQIQDVFEKFQQQNTENTDIHYDNSVKALDKMRASNAACISHTSPAHGALHTRKSWAESTVRHPNTGHLTHY